MAHQIFNERSEHSLKNAVQGYLQCLKSGGVSIPRLVFPISLGFCAAIAEGAALALFVPLLDGLLFNTFSSLERAQRYVPEGWVHFDQYSDTQLIVGLLVGVVILTLMKVGATYAGQLSIARQGRLVQVCLRQELFRRYLQFGKLFIDAKNTGYFFHILMHDTASIGGGLYLMQSVVQAVAMLFVYFALMCAISFPLTGLVLLIFPILFFALRKIVQVTSTLSSQQSNKCLELARELQNAMNNVALIKASATEGIEEQRFTETTNQVENLRLQIDARNLLIPPVQEIVTLLFVLCIVFYIYFSYLPAGGTAASAALFIILLRRASMQTTSISAFWQHMAGVSGPVANITEFLAPAGKEQLADGSLPISLFKTGIEFQDVSFEYLNRRQALTNISFTIECGKKIALVGETGSGKSTCMQLLLRFYDPSRGTIRVDGTPLSELRIDQWRRMISYVSQEVLLFNDTLEANLAYGVDETPTTEMIEQAIAVAQLKEFVSQLPEGLKTTVGDRGVLLSGGERQRIAIARAFLKNTPIILLDEPTSALDAATEENIQRALHSLTENRTVVTIAHRLATIREADLIIVLHQGQVAEVGTREELLLRDGLFHHAWSRQVSVSSEKSESGLARERD